MYSGRTDVQSGSYRDDATVVVFPQALFVVTDNKRMVMMIADCLECKAMLAGQLPSCGKMVLLKFTLCHLKLLRFQYTVLFFSLIK